MLPSTHFESRPPTRPRPPGWRSPPRSTTPLCLQSKMATTTKPPGSIVKPSIFESLLSALRIRASQCPLSLCGPRLAFYRFSVDIQANHRDAPQHCRASSRLPTIRPGRRHPTRHPASTRRRRRQNLGPNADPPRPCDARPATWLAPHGVNAPGLGVDPPSANDLGTAELEHWRHPPSSAARLSKSGRSARRHVSLFFGHSKPLAGISGTDGVSGPGGARGPEGSSELVLWRPATHLPHEEGDAKFKFSHNSCSSLELTVDFTHSLPWISLKGINTPLDQLGLARD